LLSLLKEPQDVFLNNLPLGLPPLQGIEPHIDRMQGATLPTCTAYRTKPDDQEEGQRQTHDRQAHGYVHENLSPSVVSTILVMPLGCSISLSLFLRLMQLVLKHLVDKSEDTLMCPMNLKDHIIYVREALCILWPFTHKKLISFGFAVSSIGIEVNYSNFEDIHKWPTPTTSAQARSFHAIAIFHTRHTHNISTIVCLLDVPFVWDNATQHAFHDFKMKLHYTPLLVLPKVDYTDTKFVPIFAKCSIEKEFVDFHLHDGLLSKANKIGMPDSSMRKLLLPKFLFGSDNPPPILRVRTNMDYDKRVITMKKIHEDTRVLRQATCHNAKKKG
jgi:hypothetical protein